MKTQKLTLRKVGGKRIFINTFFQATNNLLRPQAPFVACIGILQRGNSVKQVKTANCRHVANRDPIKLVQSHKLPSLRLLYSCPNSLLAIAFYTGHFEIQAKLGNNMLLTHIQNIDISIPLFPSPFYTAKILNIVESIRWQI